MKKKCIICQYLKKDIPIYETKYWRVVLASDQRYLGRCFVALKRHCGNLAELKKEEWLDFAELAKKLEAALKKAFDATMFNWTCLMNNAYQEAHPNPHVHWHFRPRYNHKVKFAGLIFEDEEFGHHYDNVKSKEISTETKNKIIEKINQKKRPA